MFSFETALARENARYETIVNRKNRPSDFYNGIYTRWEYPVLTREHAPVLWRYDLNPETNPYFMERLGVNAVFNAGAIKLNGRYYLAARVEGNDRKSFFAVAESESPVEGFRFWDYPLRLPDTCPAETNVYDMRLTRHEDGWIYGVFCSESKDPSSADLSAAVAAAGIVRTKDLKTWERLPNLVTRESPQQRNVCLLPELVDGKYAFFTRPMDGFIDTGSGSGGGIGFGLCEDITHPVIAHERITSARKYHTITESKNGAGAAVAVSLAGLEARTAAGADGRWRADLPAGPAGGPYSLTVRCGAEEICLRWVYRGEVWLAGGQSNMEMPLERSRDGARAVPDSGNPRLHFCTVPKTACASPEKLCWRTAGPETAGDLSAVAYYAGRTLTEHLDGVHVGVIVCCWGATYANCWLSRAALAEFPEGRERIDSYEAGIAGKSDEAFNREQAVYQGRLDAWNADPRGPYPWPPPAGRTSFHRPGNLYQAMVKPLAPYALRGFWYYQGEQDEERPGDYFALLTALIRCWRETWENEALPFLLAQLPMYGSESWPILREAQARAARSLPGVELAVLADCGERDDVHPADKETPGTRLGLLALEAVYGLLVAGRPPVCAEARREGSAALLRFAHTGGGLVLDSGPYAGLTLPQYIEKAGPQVLGASCRQFEMFPLLVKLIDARESLSVQVRPSDEYALAHEGQYGKTEMWVVLDAAPGAFLYYGFRREVTREEFAEHIGKGTLPDILRKLPVKKGDVVFIPAGTLHAIGAGLVIAEVQQNSNVTYRVFDYGRVGADGRPRALHVDKALEVTNLRPAAPMDFGPRLGRCRYFTTDRHTGVYTGPCGPESFQAVLIAEGSGELACGGERHGVKKGECWFLPAGSGAYCVDGPCEYFVIYLS